MAPVLCDIYSKTARPGIGTFYSFKTARTGNLFRLLVDPPATVIAHQNTSWHIAISACRQSLDKNRQTLNVTHLHTHKHNILVGSATGADDEVTLERRFTPATANLHLWAVSLSREVVLPWPLAHLRNCPARQAELAVTLVAVSRQAHQTATINTLRPSFEIVLPQAHVLKRPIRCWSWAR